MLSLLQYHIDFHIFVKNGNLLFAIYDKHLYKCVYMKNGCISEGVIESLKSGTRGKLSLAKIIFGNLTAYFFDNLLFLADLPNSENGRLGRNKFLVPKKHI